MVNKYVSYHETKTHKTENRRGYQALTTRDTGNTRQYTYTADKQINLDLKFKKETMKTNVGGNST
jgi:hypothetical protein